MRERQKEKEREREKEKERERKREREREVVYHRELSPHTPAQVGVEWSLWGTP